LILTLKNFKKKHHEFQLLENYFNNTAENRNYSISTIYRVQRKGEAERISKWKSIPNHFLLWHGTDVSSFMGILSEGLKLPLHHGNFGKGIYFADMFSKSINYCSNASPDPENQSIQLLLLFEVALGKIFEVNTLKAWEVAKTLEEPVDTFQSTKGVGLSGPDFKDSIIFPNGVEVPVGKVVKYATPKNVKPKLKQGRKSRAKLGGLYRLHPHSIVQEDMSSGADISEPEPEPFFSPVIQNEYIVYDPSQVRVRYIVQVDEKKDDADKKLTEEQLRQDVFRFLTPIIEKASTLAGKNEMTAAHVNAAIKSIKNI